MVPVTYAPSLATTAVSLVPLVGQHSQLERNEVSETVRKKGKAIPVTGREARSVVRRRGSHIF
jgi:hypothetical protein